MPDLLGIGTAINAGVNLGKAVIGGIQSIKGRKELNNLLDNRPKYNISQGYLDAYKTYQGLANQQMPGYDLMLGQLGQSTAKTQVAAERGAMGSNQYLDALLKSQDKEMEAIRNLGIASAQWRTQQRQNLAGAQNQMGQLQDTQFQVNQLDPWGIKTNMAAEKRLVGNQNLWGGLQGMASTASDYLGTKYYLDALKGLYPKNANNNTPALGDVAGFKQFTAPKPTVGWMNYKGTLNG